MSFRPTLRGLESLLILLPHEFKRQLSAAELVEVPSYCARSRAARASRSDRPPPDTLASRPAKHMATLLD
eukprot:4160906-Pyramimonas_sp.AAC.1